MRRVWVVVQSAVAVCSEMDSEWEYCSAPESGIQLLADTINHCCPGWSSAHTTTATASADDEQGEEDEVDEETGQRSTWAKKIFYSVYPRFSISASLLCFG